MKKQRFTKKLSLWVTPEMMNRLNRLSRKTSRTKTELVREAIAKLLEEYETEKAGR